MCGESMNQIIWKDIWREIKRSAPRFLSIAAIIALGVAFFIGIKVSGPSMILTAQSYYADNHMPHGKVIGTQGLDKKDIQKLQEVPVEWLPMQTVYADMDVHNLKAKLFELPTNEQHNFFKVTRGRLPINQSEVALDAAIVNVYPDIELGQKITFDGGEQSTETDQAPRLESNKMTVVGFVESPIYFERNDRGTEMIDLFAVVASKSIKGSLFTEAFYWIPNLSNADSFSETWETRINDYSKQIENVLSQQGEMRYQRIQNNAFDQIEAGQKEIDEGYGELAEAETSLEEASQELSEAKRDIDTGAEKLQIAQTKYRKGRSEYRKGWQNYQTGFQTFEQNLQTFNTKLESYNQGLEEYNKEMALINGGFDEQLKLISEQEMLLSNALIKLKENKPNLETEVQQADQSLAKITGELQQIAPGITATDTIAAYIYQQNLTKQQLQTDLSSLQVHLNNVEDEDPLIQAITNLKNEIVHLESTIVNRQQHLRSIPSENTDEIATIQAEITALKKDLALLSEQKNAKLTKLETIQSQKKDLDAQIQSTQQQIESINAIVNQLHQYNTQNAARIEKAQERKSKADQAFATYTEDEKKLSSQLEEIKTQKEAIQEQKETLPEKLDQAKIKLDSQAPLIQAGKDKFAQTQQTLEVSKLKLDKSQQQLNAAKEEIIKGLRELESAKKQWKEGLDDYQVGLETFNAETKKNKKKLKEAQIKLDSKREDLKELLTPEYLIMPAPDDSIYQGLKNNAKQLNVISNIFPVFFLAIAVLVTYTTIKRMTTEHRNFMGTMKQMGYSDAVIISKFVIYAGFAAVLGIVIGITLGYAVFPPVVIGAYNTMYQFEAPKTQNMMIWNGIVSLIAIATVLMPAIASPLNYLKGTPASLLRPPAPTSGRKIWLEKISIIWKRFNFKQKMTWRNLMRYKMRSLMTLLGIAGCTMLIVTGYGISHTINGILDYQFEHIQKVDEIVVLEEDVTASDISTIERQLVNNEAVASVIPVYQRNISTNISGIQNQDVTVIVPTGSIKNFQAHIQLAERGSKSPLNLKDNILMTERLEEHVHALKKGELSAKVDAMTMHLPVTHVIENYIGHYIYLSQESYLKYFLEKAETNQFYVELKVNQTDKMDDITRDIKGVQATINLTDLAAGIKSSLSSLDIITLVLILSAAGLAFVVLYNLTNINIEERMKELATIKVLGFYSREVSMYIYEEILILTLIGSLLGCFFGWILTHFLMKTMQLNNILFYPRVHLSGYLISIVFTFIFSAFIMLIMHRKIRSINMVEALKAVE